MQRKPIFERREESGLYVHPTLEDIRAEETLCSACANRRECPMLGDIEDLEQADRVGVLVTSCPDYEPDPHRVALDA